MGVMPQRLAGGSGRKLSTNGQTLNLADEQRGSEDRFDSYRCIAEMCTQIKANSRGQRLRKQYV